MVTIGVAMATNIKTTYTAQCFRPTATFRLILIQKVEMDGTHSVSCPVAGDL